MRLILLGCAALLVPLAAAQTPPTHQHGFGDARKWAQVFDDPERDAWQKPHQVIQALALKPDAIVADIGAGTGYFAARLANMLPNGRVYAVDVEPDMVRYLRERAKRERYFRRLADSLRPGGRLAVIDFRPDSPECPPKQARIPAGRVKAELAQAGWRLVAEHGFLPRQYFLVFRPAPGLDRDQRRARPRA